MNWMYVGAMIRKERLRREWSQEGLCKGICAVSYLSKIEQGKAEGSQEVVRLLLRRLELPWHGEETTVNQIQALVERCWESVLSGEKPAWGELHQQMKGWEEQISHGPYALDGMLLGEMLSGRMNPVEESLESYLDRRQLAFQRLMQNRGEEAMRLYPCAAICLWAGIGIYERGERAGTALDYLRQAHQMAADEGALYIMLQARVYMGNHYANLLDYENMREQYRVARRMAVVMGEEEMMRDIAYNEAAAALELGECEVAYRYFSQLDHPSIMELHKLAIACEKLGKQDQAMEALERAQKEEGWTPLFHPMCQLVRYRLEHPDYLLHPEYGQRVLHLFQQCKDQLPIGYAAFHLPWVLEWYTATRQYRAAYELMRDFPIKHPVT